MTAPMPPLRAIHEDEHPDVLVQQLPGATATPERSWHTKVAIGIILLGLFNFTAFTVVAVSIGGDAKNGGIQIVENREGLAEKTFFLRIMDTSREVSRGIWIYSYIHCISIWITQAAILLSLLALARPHIEQRLQDSAIKGQTVVTIIATLTVFIIGVMTAAFVIEFIKDLTV